MTFSIRIYKDLKRITPIYVGSGVDVRLLYLYLKNYMAKYKKVHPTVNNRSILVSINGKETYRKRKKLEEADINNIQNIIDYFGIDPKIIMVDGLPTEDKTKPLSEIFVLELN